MKAAPQNHQDHLLEFLYDLQVPGISSTFCASFKKFAKIFGMGEFPKVTVFNAICLSKAIKLSVFELTEFFATVEGIYKCDVIFLPSTESATALGASGFLDALPTRFFKERSFSTRLFGCFFTS